MLECANAFSGMALTRAGRQFGSSPATTLAD
jgi:hypothetical protein